MQVEGTFRWTGNNSYGDNHRTLKISLGRFALERTHSAGGRGSSGDTVQGRVEPIGEGRFALIAETVEDWVRDDDPWFQTRPSTARFELVIGAQITLDGEGYVRA